MHNSLNSKQFDEGRAVGINTGLDFLGHLQVPIRAGRQRCRCLRIAFTYRKASVLRR